MKVLAKFFWDCGSGGDIDGLFIAEKSKIEAGVAYRYADAMMKVRKEHL